MSSVSKRKPYPHIPETVVYPTSLYKSLQGRYFVGYADYISYGRGTNAWAGLFNPSDSDIDLHVNVVTLTQVSGLPFRGELWVNAEFPGTPQTSPLVTPANMALQPLPEPKVQLLQASEVSGNPVGGSLIDWEQSILETTVIVEYGGSLIIPPGGSLAVYLASQGASAEPSSGRIAFGWYEDPAIRNERR